MINAAADQQISLELEADLDDPPDPDGELITSDTEEDERADILSIVEAICGHWESETHESVMSWSWPLFCTKWARLYEQHIARRKAERRRKRKSAQDRELQLRRRHDEEWFAQVQQQQLQSGSDE